MDLESDILEFLHGDEDGKTPGRGPRDRYASFDYCFNYFQSFREAGAMKALATPEHAQTSCVHLGFYLARWGMLRGSSFLLRKSLAVYEPVVRAISDMDRAVWEIDAHCYTDANLTVLLEGSEAIRAAFGTGNCPSDALVTKVMLGVFGNVPAFDFFVHKALGELLGVQSFWEAIIAGVGPLLRDPQRGDRAASRANACLRNRPRHLQALHTGESDGHGALHRGPASPEGLIT